MVTKKHQGRLQALVYRVRCGAKRFEELGLSISTSLLERLNLTLRQALAPLVRKSGSFCKDRTQMRRRVVLFQAFYNFARPHMSLRLPLPEQEPPASGLIQPRWRHRTHIPHPSDGDPRHFLAAFFARTTNPPSGMVSSHERRYTKHLRPGRVVWVSCSRLSKRTTSNICPL